MSETIVAVATLTFTAIAAAALFAAPGLAVGAAVGGLITPLLIAAFDD